MSGRALNSLLPAIRACTLCTDLPLGPKPLLQVSDTAKVLIVGQAPGRITHEKGIPFDDPSGRRLREWMGISSDIFYDPQRIAIVPMAFCFPGSGKSGDLPPRPECETAWRAELLSALSQVELTLIIGQYAIAYHIKDGVKRTLTDRVKGFETDLPSKIVLPHPSPRNNIWLKRNPWFEISVLPVLKTRVQESLSHT